MPVSTDRLVRGQVLFRHLNERFSEDAESHFIANPGVAFVCECRTRDCDEFIALDLEEYKAIRSLPMLFLVAPGHETPQVENVVETNDLYALVEKIREVELVTGSHQPITERQA